MKRLVSLLAALLACAVQAQEPLVETIEVRVTNIDVVVTDRSGKPVTNLGRDDFELLENGKPQTITNFYEIRPDGTAAREVSGDEEQLQSADELRRRRVIFFIDEYSIHPMRRNEVFEALNRYLDKLFQPGDEATIVTWNRGIRIAVPFTSDVAALKAGLSDAAKKNTGALALPMERERIKRKIQGDVEEAQSRRITWGEAYSRSFGSVREHADELYYAERALLRDMTTTLSTLAGVEGKKVMVFAGAQLPEKPALDLFMYVESTYPSHITNARAGRSLTEASTRNLAGLQESVAKEANAVGVTLYMIDAADSRGRSAEHAVVESQEVEFANFSNSFVSFDKMARITGGMSLLRANTFDHAFDTLARDLSAYYSLGYRPEGESDSERRVVVKTKKPGLFVRARQTYTPRTADEQMNDRVIANAYHDGVKSEMPIRLDVGKPVKHTGNRFKVPVTVEIPSDITMLPMDDQLVGGFHLYVVVGDPNGATSKVTKHSRKVQVPVAEEAALRSKPMTFTMEVVMTPGEHRLSVGVVDQIASTAGFAKAKVVAQ